MIPPFTSEPLQAILTDKERGALFEWIEEEEANSGLSGLRERFIDHWDNSFQTADEYMDNYLDLLKYLLKKYKEDNEISQKVEVEILLSKQWIEGQEPEYEIEGHKPWNKENVTDDFGPSERSIFDDIDA